MPDMVSLAARDWGANLCRGLEAMWQQSVNCDTVIYSSDGQTFNAHAAVLMASSPALNSQLRVKNKKTLSVESKRINSTSWSTLLKFMYSGTSNVERPDLEPLLEASQELEIHELSQLCLQQLNNAPLAPGSLSQEESTVQNLSMKKEVAETATDLSVKPAQTSEVITMAPQQGLLNMPGHGHMWMPQQLRPLQWPFPFPPNMMPTGQHLPPPFMGGNPRQPLPPVSMTSPSNSAPSPTYTQPQLNLSPDSDESKRHRCTYCGKRFKLRHVLQQHELTHTNIKPYYCDICGFRARQKAVIWKHKKLKHGKEEHVPIRVSMDDGLQDLSTLEDGAVMSNESSPNHEDRVTPPSTMPSPHEKQMTPPSQNLVSIPESPSVFGNSPRQFICHTCHKSFRNKHVLAQHELIHSNFRPYACDYCDFRAKQKAVIWRHIKVKHADMKEVSYRTESPPRTPEGTIIEPEDPIKKEELPVKPTWGRHVNNVIDRLKTSLSSKRKKSYDLKPSLFSVANQGAPTMVPPQHSSPVTLTGFSSLYRRFQCKHCFKYFKNKHILLQHELVHSNVRPYKCQFCVFRAKQKAVMWRHLKSRHPEKGRCRIVEDIDLAQIRESSAAEFSRESNLQGMANNMQDSTIEDPQEKSEKEEIEEPMDIGNGLNEEEEVEEMEEDLDYESDDDDMNEGDKFFCQTCGKGFNEKDAMEQHQKRHIKPLTCDVCGFRTRVPENMERHKRVKHTKKPVEEKVENTNYILNPALVNESTHPTPSMIHQQQPPIMQDVRPRISADGKRKLFYCNMCTFCTAHQTSLSRHKRLKHDAELRTDDMHSQGSDCDETKPQVNASVPQPSSSAEPGSPAIPPAHLMPFGLQQNPVSFSMFPNPPVMPMQMHLQNQQQLQQQLQQANGDPDKKYRCRVCGRYFKHRHVLHQHSLVHTDLKPYACEFCDFRGRQKASLWRHRQKHLATMGKGYIPPNKDLFGSDDIYADNSSTFPNMLSEKQDNEQGPVFPSAQDEEEDESENEPDDTLLLAQEYAKKGEEEVVSEGEDMEGFAEKVTTEDDRQEAYVVPTADGKYACSLCGHILASKMSCQRHCHTHITGRCYKCQECGYQTPYSYTLQRHIRTHTRDKQYSCDSCDQTFNKSESLLEHKLIHHKEGAGDTAKDEQCDQTMAQDDEAHVVDTKA